MYTVFRRCVSEYDKGYAKNDGLEKCGLKLLYQHTFSVFINVLTSLAGNIFYLINLRMTVGSMYLSYLHLYESKSSSQPLYV